MAGKQNAVGLYKSRSTPSSSAFRPRVCEVKATFSGTADISRLNQTPATVSYLRRMSFYFVFHVFNSFLGVAAFAVIVFGLSLSAVLLPLCGFGVIIFQALGVITEKLGQIDVAIANLVVDERNSGKRLRADPRIKVTEFAVPCCERSSATKSSSTPQPSNRVIAKVILYFATVKFAVGVLSGLMVAFVVSFLIAIFSKTSVPDLKICEHECTDNSIVFLLVAMGVFVLSNVLLVVIAMISRELTEMVCADTQSVELEHEVQVDVLSGGHQGVETLDAVQVYHSTV